VDDPDECLELLREAAAIADADGFRLGRRRALVSLGYVTVVALSSATAAAESLGGLDLLTALDREQRGRGRRRPSPCTVVVYKPML
jgi:hypothetical protein